ELLLDEVDGRRALRPVRRGDGEDVRIALTVGGGGAAEARRRAGDPILGELRGERVDVGRAVGRHRLGALLLVTLIRLDYGRYVVRTLVCVFYLVRFELVSLYSPLGVHERDVIMKPGAQDRADDLGGARAVALHADDDLALRLLGGRRRCQHAARRQYQRRRN